MTVAPADVSLRLCDRPGDRSTELGHAQVPHPLGVRELINIFCFLKLLSLGLICCAAIDD